MECKAAEMNFVELINLNVGDTFTTKANYDKIFIKIARLEYTDKSTDRICSINAICLNDGSLLNLSDYATVIPITGTFSYHIKFS